MLFHKFDITGLNLVLNWSDWHVSFVFGMWQFALRISDLGGRHQENWEKGHSLKKEVFSFRRSVNQIKNIRILTNDNNLAL